MNDEEKQTLLAKNELKKAVRGFRKRRQTVQTRIEISLHDKLKVVASRRGLTLSKLLDILLKAALRTLGND